MKKTRYFQYDHKKFIFRYIWAFWQKRNFSKKFKKQLLSIINFSRNVDIFGLIQKNLKNSPKRFSQGSHIGKKEIFQKNSKTSPMISKRVTFLRMSIYFDIWAKNIFFKRI